MSDVKKSGAWFAWVTNPRGLSPVKFHDGINATEMKTVVDAHEIQKEDLLLSFGQLAKMFPAPVSREHPSAWPDYKDETHGKRRENSNDTNFGLSATASREIGLGEQSQSIRGNVTATFGFALSAWRY
jgi:hypothetical protein